MKRMRAILAFAMTTAMVTGMVGCGSSSTATSTEASESTTESAAEDGSESTETGIMEQIKESGKLVMGTASGYPPFEFVSVENNGKVIGIDVELGQAIADELGVTLEVQDMAFAELVTSLQTGNCDIVIAGMPETEEKAQVVDFSDVYVNDVQSVLVRAEDAESYTSLADFSGKTIAVEMGSSSESVAKNEIADSTIDSLSLISDCFLELENGKCDAVVTGSVVGRQYVIANSNLVELDNVSFTNSDKANQVCIAKGETEFMDLINEVIKTNQDNGNFDTWIEKYSQQASKEAE